MTEFPPPPPHLDWQAEALWQRLQPMLPGLNIEVLASVGSTNATLLARARGEPDSTGGADGTPRLGRRQADLQPALLVAEQQTAGRGRQGKGWQSAAGASLTFSLALPLAPAHGWSGLSLAVGCALADALDPTDARGVHAAPALMLKWPNDLWLRDDDAPGGGRKLGGILIETAPVGAQRLVVVGIGLNVHVPAAPEPAQLSSGLGCVDELDPAATPPAVLARVAPPLVQALRRFEAGGFAPFAAAFARRDLLAGRPLRTQGAVVLEGTGAGVDAQGVLQLRMADGRLHGVGSGEVSVRPC
ncbi:MAG: biotin--[acetyl-CoA-carboxylase] ligase [Burkholderiaceae bacterium]|nr:biotin--[acetyl-CoA-carboxylase] ligase [Burkholderiaceae bacterium]